MSGCWIPRVASVIDFPLAVACVFNNSYRRLSAFLGLSIWRPRTLGQEMTLTIFWPSPSFDDTTNNSIIY